MAIRAWNFLMSQEIDSSNGRWMTANHRTVSHGHIQPILNYLYSCRHIHRIFEFNEFSAESTIFQYSVWHTMHTKQLEKKTNKCAEHRWREKWRRRNVFEKKISIPWLWSQSIGKTFMLTCCCCCCVENKLLFFFCEKMKLLEPFFSYLFII